MTSRALPACLVVEIKSVLVDVQLTLSTLDRKVRISEVLARERTWQPIARIPVLAIREGSTARRRVAAHASLFGRFDARGRTAVGWLMRPRAPMPSGILMLRSRQMRVLATLDGLDASACVWRVAVHAQPVLPAVA
jgi:hypothetical protein